MLKLLLLCVLLPVCGQAMQDPAVTQGDALDELRRDLLTTGVEARKARERAVGGLLLRKELRAHMILQQTLRAAEDPDLLVPFVLDQLEKKWAQRQDPVFGDGSSLRLDLLKSYGSVIVRLLSVENRSTRDASQLALEEQVVACLRDSIRPDERMQVFMFLLDAPDSGRDIALMSAAMFAAAGCRDMRLIPLVARFLDDPELGATAQLALQEKTILSELFANTREFGQWWQHNQGKTNIELIEDSARESLAKINEINQVTLLKQQVSVAKVVVYAAKVGDWPELVRVLSGPGDKASRELYLEELLKALRTLSSLPGDAAERIKLLARLLELLEASENGVRALVLENLAYLVSAGDGDSYARVEKSLHDGLFSGRPVEALAAFRGIRRFFTAENRNQVVLAAGAFQRKGDASGLLAGLNCLSAQGWQPPGKDDQDLASWISLLESVFGDKTLDHAAKEAAIDVARTASSDPEMVSRVMSLLLTSVLENQAQAVRVRRYALDNLPAFVADPAGREDAYLAAVSGLLDDPDEQMRKRAAEVLKAPPFSGFAENIRSKWIPTIVVKVANRLSEERDADVLSALVDLMVWMNDEPGGDNVVGRLRDVADKITQPDANIDNLELRRQLAKGLEILGGISDSSPAQWVTAGEALLTLDDRLGLRTVLNMHPLASLSRAGDDQWTRKACKLVIDAARARPLDADWVTTEAIELEFAFQELGQLGGLQDGSYDNQSTRLLRLSALASQGLHDLVVKKGVAYLADPSQAFAPAREAQVRVLIARAFIAKGSSPPDVEEQLQRLSGHPDLPQLWLEVAGMYFTAKDWDPALQIVSEHLASKTSPLYREAFLLRIGCLLGKQPQQGVGVLAELRSAASLFQGEDVPDDLVQRYQTLLSAANKG